MKFLKISFITLLILFSINFKVLATTLGPIDVIGYPSQGSAIDTLRNAFNYFANKEDGFWRQQFFIKDSFYKRGMVFSIPIFKDRPEMNYKLWLQMKPAPLITIVPGMGSMYLEQTLLVLANMFFDAGYSVLAISNAFNWEFMQSASTTPTPGYTIRDSQDTYYALYKISEQLKEKYGNIITDNIMVGYSLGAIYTLFISILDEKYQLVNYQRFLAVNPPLDLLFGVKTLDSFFKVIDSWPKTKVDEKASKALALYNKLIQGEMDINEKIPLDAAEAQYVIGLSFHGTLTDMLSSIAERHQDNNIFLNKFMWSNRKGLYNELNNYSYYKYIKLFVLPYYSKEFNAKFTMDDLNDWASLKNFDQALIDNPKIRIIHNVNDFLLTEEDKIWFSKIFGDRIIFFSHGGHIGNMFFPEVQKFILEGVNLNNTTGFTGPEVEKIKNEAYQEYLESLSPEDRKELEAKVEKELPNSKAAQQAKASN